MRFGNDASGLVDWELESDRANFGNWLGKEDCENSRG